MNHTNKHFYTTSDFTKDEILHLVDLALKLKKGQVKKNLNGKTLCMLFFNPSLRTRVSFAVAMKKLGGLAIDIPIKDGAYKFEFKEEAVMDKDSIEHVKDANRVLSKYCDAIAVRSSQLVTSESKSVDVESWNEMKKDKTVKAFMKYSDVPVINMESNVFHPCQGLGDAVTIVEKISCKKTSGVSFDDSPEVKESAKPLRNKKYVLTWVDHPKALPVATPHSQILAACDLGLDVTIVHPKEWELDIDIIKTAEQRAKQAGGSLNISFNQYRAFKGADFIISKSWGALKYYGNWNEEKKIREGLKHWIVDQKKMKITNNAYFMHCLPVRRNVEATDKVLDSRNSIIYEQAENRIWAQMAILLHCMQK